MKQSHLCADRALIRLADLSAAIGYRLYEVRNWSDEDKRAHKAAIVERDMILAAASPQYLSIISRARAVEAKELPPAPWRVWLVCRLARALLKYD